MFFPAYQCYLFKRPFTGVMTPFITSRGPLCTSHVWYMFHTWKRRKNHQPNLGKHAQSNAWYWKYSIKWDILGAFLLSLKNGWLFGHIWALKSGQIANNLYRPLKKQLTQQCGYSMIQCGIYKYHTINT